MNFVDFAIIGILIGIVSVVVYFSFIKNSGDVCGNCPYSKSCNKKNCNSKLK